MAAQLLGIYGLVTRKADLIFALVMVALLVGAVVLGRGGRLPPHPLTDPRSVSAR